MQAVDRTDFAIFMTIYIAKCKYEIADMDFDTYLEILNDGMEACKLIHKQEKERIKSHDHRTDA